MKVQLKLTGKNVADCLVCLETENKGLAAYGILWDTPRAPGYSHLHLTFLL